MDIPIRAFRGDTGGPIVTSEPLNGLRHFQTLIATRDRLYVGADGRIYVKPIVTFSTKDPNNSIPTLNPILSSVNSVYHGIGQQIVRC